MERYTLGGIKIFLSTKLLSQHCITKQFKKKLSSSIYKSKSTIDSEDVKRHTKQAKYWWDPNGAVKLLHHFNLLRVPFIRDGLVSHSEDMRTIAPLSNISILDVGCGGGILTEALARIGANMTGIDASQDLIEVAKEHSKGNPKLVHNRPTYYCNTIEEHSEQYCNHYDAVVASEIIEHVTDKELFVKSCVSALKPGGIIFFTTPNRSRMTQIFGICIAENILHIIPKGTHQYEKLMTPNELTFLLERNNCHVQLVHGFLFNPITNKWSLVKSTNLLFGLRAVKLQLLISPIKIFWKDVISFLIIRRNDLGIIDDKLRYLAVRPTASISQLRQKVWYLLELPDFCEEIIVLKRGDYEIPLTELRKGNDPQHPYTLEVWLPEKQRSSILLNNMLTMGDNRTIAEDFGSPESIFTEKVNCEYKSVEKENMKQNEIMKTMNSMENKQSIRKFLNLDYKRSDLSCKLSTSSIFYKLNGRKSKDNFTNMLLRIQSDLKTLNTKLSDLENRIHV